MKARLNITIDRDILEKIRHYSEQNKLSISNIIEDYFKNIVQKRKPSTFLDKVKKLPKIDIDKNIDFKKTYYNEKYKL